MIDDNEMPILSELSETHPPYEKKSARPEASKKLTAESWRSLIELFGCGGAEGEKSSMLFTTIVWHIGLDIGLTDIEGDKDGTCDI